MKLFLVAALLATASQAADLSGTWVGQIPARRLSGGASEGQVQDVAFRFKQEGSVLTGKIYGDSESLAIREGKIDGDRITFIITGENQTKFTYECTMKDGAIEVTRRRELRPEELDDPTRKVIPQTFTLKRLL